MNTIPNPEHPLDDTRRRIIQAAIQLFGQVGYSQATTRMLAEAAGVNEVTLFRHFGSKKNLLLACVAEFNAAGFAASFEAGLTGDYPQDILYMAQKQIQETTANLELLRVLVCDARNVPELGEALVGGGQGNLSRLADYFQRQIDQGVVRRDIPAEILASAFDSLFSANIIFEALFRSSLSPHLSGAAIVRPLVDLFVGGTVAAAERQA